MIINNYIEITNEDNMELMKRFPDNYFDLAVVDPPYGLGMDKSRNSNKGNKAGFKIYHDTDWDCKSPDKEYFDELLRVSKNQIVWGANHFISKIPYDSSCWIVWDKKNGDSDNADAELAWASFKTAVRKYSIHISTTFKNRIHPTQKPIELYEWIFTKYAEPNQKILDTHLGSGSIAIALDNVNKMEKMNLTLTACELDKKYFETSTSRIIQETNWTSLF
jgi:site-specific DNA-methyltransferase (adenine-specific)